MATMMRKFSKFVQVAKNKIHGFTSVAMFGSNCKLYGFKLRVQLRLRCKPLCYSKIQTIATKIAVAM